MKTMGWQQGNNSSNNGLAFFSGIIGGIIQFFMNIHLNVDFWPKLVEAAITAGVCGFLGIAGKEIFVLGRDAMKEWLKERKSKKRRNHD